MAPRRRRNGWLLPLFTLVLLVTPPAAADKAGARPASAAEAARVGVVIELAAPPVLAVYAAQRQAGEVSAAALAAVTQAHLAVLEQAQQALLGELAGFDAQVLYRTQRVYNGIAVRVPAGQAAALARLPGVRALHPLTAKWPAGLVTSPQSATSRTVTAQVDGSTAGLTGRGVTIALIDTGVDYLHADFGGPGSGHAANDPTQVGDAPNYPGPKVIGGYDFAGDLYDADATSPSYRPTPVPDPDPMDCYGLGHGTHTAGSAAGYGVTASGAPYPGPYPPSAAASLRIGPGSAPAAQIYALKVFGCQGSSEIVDAAIEWAVDPNGDGDFADRADVINLSLGSPFGATDDPTTVAAENAAQAGVIVVASAGNNGDLVYAASAPAVGAHVLAVAAMDGDLSGGAGRASMAGFSSRGPRRGDAAIKPDLAAPGVAIHSARRGPGSLGVARNGTSMAAALAAGTLAVLRQARPAAPLTGRGWTVEELKALVVNTAVPLVPPDGRPYNPVRSGAGAIDLAAALAGQVIAYNAAAPAMVGVSFGTPEVLDRYQAVATVAVANKGTAAVTLTVGYSEATRVPGVTLQVDAGQVLSVAAGAYATLPVTLTVDGAALRHTHDGAPAETGSMPASWLSEASGYLLLTPAAGAPVLRVPLYAAPQPAGLLQAAPAALDFGAAPAGTAAFTLRGVPLASGGVLTATVPPTMPVALAGLFALHTRSPALAEPPAGALPGLPYAQADLRAVGMAGPLAAGSAPAMLYFALHTYAPWSTPHEVTFIIYFDVDDDGGADLFLANHDLAGALSDEPAGDAFVSVLEDLSTGLRKVQGPLNGYTAAELDPRLFNTDVMVLPVRLAELRLRGQRFRYSVESYSEDISNARRLGLVVDRTPWRTVDLQAQTVEVVASGGLPLLVVTSGDRLGMRFRREGDARPGVAGVLAVYPTNPAGRRVQIIPVGYDRPYPVYLPWLPIPGKGKN